MPLLLGLLLALTIPARAEAGSPAARIPVSSEWRYTFTDDAAYRLPSADDSPWKVTRLPASFDRTASGGSRFLWLRAPLVLDRAAADPRLFLLGGKIWGSVEFYLNGVLIGFHGSFPPRFEYVLGYLKSAAIPRDLLRADGRNVIAIRVFNESAAFTVPAPEVGGEAAYAAEDGQNFLNLDIYLIFSMLCFFIFCFYFLQFALRREERPKLLFALSNLGFAIYFLNMGLKRQFLPYVAFNAFSKSLLVLVIATLAVFFLEFFLIHNKRWLKILLLAPAFCIAVPFWFLPRTIADVSNLFVLSLIPVEIEIIFMTYLSVRALLARNRDAVPIIFGVVAGISCGTYDVIYQVSGRDPAFWLQGIGIFTFNLSMFAALSLQQIRMRREIETFSTALEQRTGELEQYIRAAGEVSSSVSAMAKDLEEGIATASSSVEKFSRRSQEISNTIAGQFDVVKETESTVMGLLGSLDGVYAALESQAREVEKTSSTVQSMLSSVQGIAESLRETSDFTGQLGEKTRAGEAAVAASTEAIGKVREASASIQEIVDTVSELAERTNLLAMNAAIEAAHAGSVGRGFAVVAAEIKTFSEASAKRSQEIMGHIGSIRQRIDDGVRVNSRVSEVLSDISSSTGTAIDRVQAVYEAVDAQRQASERISASLASLRESTARIRAQADSQKAGSGVIRGRLEGLVSSSEDVLESVRAIGEENGRIVELVGKIQNISTAGGQIISRMESLLRGHQAAEKPA